VLSSVSLQSIGVFCGSSPGARPEYAAAAQQVGRLMAEQDITLVYGGGRVGLMGVLADAVLEVGGRVIGVIPKILYRKEVAHQDLTELRVVDSMSERKAVIGELSDAFIALPGGIGTLDEIFEVWTWTQLGLQHKYSGLLNVGGYFDPLIDFVDRAVREGFLSAQNRQVLLVETDAARLLTRLSADPAHEREALSGD
jgi:uncharacterized protein (TIGR00730 family)